MIKNIPISTNKYPLLTIFRILKQSPTSHPITHSLRLIKITQMTAIKILKVSKQSFLYFKSHFAHWLSLYPDICLYTMYILHAYMQLFCLVVLSTESHERLSKVSKKPHKLSKATIYANSLISSSPTFESYAPIASSTSFSTASVPVALPVKVFPGYLPLYINPD